MAIIQLMDTNLCQVCPYFREKLGLQADGVVVSYTLCMRKDCDNWIGRPVRPWPNVGVYDMPEAGSDHAE